MIFTNDRFASRSDQRHQLKLLLWLELIARITLKEHTSTTTCGKIQIQTFISLNALTITGVNITNVAEPN